jgi:FkbM family methyltransferase
MSNSSSFKLSPFVLMDVGASDGPPAAWEALAPQAIYVGFDPDSREMRQPQTRFHQTFILSQALSPDPQASEVKFYLTRSPYCSSTLAPNLPALGSYLHQALFEVEHQTAAPAISLDAALDRLGLAQVHWLKLDTQGTDGRLFASLSPARQKHLLAVDVEPGLLEAYLGEDMFPQVHMQLRAAGFWLAGLKVEGTVRGRPDVLGPALGYQAEQLKLYSRAFKISPGWCEGHYLRSVESLLGNPWEDYYRLAWLAQAEGHYPFALECLQAAQAQFSALPQEVKQLELELIAQMRQLLARAGAKPPLLRRAYYKARLWWGKINPPRP